MPLHFRKNLYQGVNAHLQSHYQAHGGWEGFHHTFIIFLVNILNRLLPDGYVVDTEQSLQIREVDPHTGEKIKVYRPKPDVTLYQQAVQPQQRQAGIVTEPTLTIPMLETIKLPEEYYLTTAVIHELNDGQIIGNPVTQIELLSPSNKPPGEGFNQYYEKRRICLKSGLNMVEIDLLHESRAPIPGIPDYTRQQTGAFPYYVAISKPYPAIEDSKTSVYGWAVDQPFPILAFPLSGQHTVAVDLNEVYQHAFENSHAHSLRVDYAQLPDHFERYHPADQDKIKAVMQRAQAKGDQE